MPSSPTFVSGSFQAINDRWRLTFSRPIVSGPAVPTLTDWVIDPAGSALSPTSLDVAGGLVRLNNAAWDGTETIVQYTKSPGEDFAAADGGVLQSFTGSL